MDFTDQLKVCLNQTRCVCVCSRLISLEISRVKMFLLYNFSRVLFFRAARVRAVFVIRLLPGNIFGFTLCNISSNYAIPPATLWRVAAAARESSQDCRFSPIFFFLADYLRSVRPHFAHKVESRGCKSFVEIFDKYHFLVTIVMQSRTFKRKRCCILL